MTELFSKIKKNDVEQIIPTVKKIIQLLYGEGKITRVNVIRSLVVSLTEASKEWLSADREILESSIKDPKMLSEVLLERYMANYVAILLLTVEHFEFIDIEQKKTLFKNALKLLEKVEDDKHKKIIL